MDAASLIREVAAAGRVRRAAYAFDSMQIGDAFHVPVPRGPARANRRITILGAARKSGITVATRSTPTGLLVERRA